jgi:hypothetical protein
MCSHGPRTAIGGTAPAPRGGAASAARPGRGVGGDRLVAVPRNTLETAPATTVLVVGGPHALLECTQQAARTVPPAQVVSCELRDAPTRVAELWPFAIVMSEDLYAFDSAEFDALARDVRARLITVTVDASAAIVEAAALGDKILEAFRRRLA